LVRCPVLEVPQKEVHGAGDQEGQDGLAGDLHQLQE